ncbi:MAG: hypothetical protein HC876_03780 [Chloroflexaceae bacterium]|nr:hypothetical protein [Chloroflexaceae bacterium]
MDEAAAAAQLAELEQQLMLPLELEAGTVITTLRPLDIGLTLPIDSLLAEARQASETGAAARVALQVDYDTHALQARLDSFAAQLASTTPLNLLTETDTFSRSFVYTPALTINMEQAVQVIERRLASPLAARRVTLELVSDPDRAPEPVPLAQIQPQIEAMAALWDGIVGVYVYDLATGETISYNADTVFSGASVMKVPILLQAYANLPELTEKQRFWARTMILESDNLNANALLAASVGGAGTEDALVAVQQMTASLQQLGLQHTYQNLPYEAYEYLVLLNGYENTLWPTAGRHAALYRGRPAGTHHTRRDWQSVCNAGSVQHGRRAAARTIQRKPDGAALPGNARSAGRESRRYPHAVGPAHRCTGGTQGRMGGRYAGRCRHCAVAGGRLCAGGVSLPGN